MSDKQQYPILIVDDELPNVEVLIEKLRREFVVDAVQSGPDALEKMKTKQYAVVVSDHKMAPMDGVTLLEQVSRLYPETIRLLITGYTDYEAAVDAINKGHVYRYIFKSRTIANEIVALVQQALDYYWERRERIRLQNIIRNYQDQVVEIAPKQRELKDPNMRNNKTIVVRAYDREKYSAAYKFTSWCEGALTMKYFDRSGSWFPGVKQPEGLNLTYGLYGYFFPQWKAIHELNQILHNEALVQEVVSLMIDKEVKRIDFENILTKNGVAELLAGKASDALYESNSWMHAEQFYVYSDRRVGIIQRQPEFVAVKVIERRQGDRILFSHECISDGERIYGKVIDAANQTYQWWYEDGREITPEVFIEPFFKIIQG